MASSNLCCNFPPNCGVETLCWSPKHNSVILRHKDPRYFQSNNFGLQWSHYSKRNFVVCASSVPPEAPLPSKPSSNSFIKKILGAVMTFIVPFLTNKFGPFWLFKNKIENTVEIVEEVVNVVEKVAEQVEKVAEDVADDLPDGNLKNIVDFVEDVAEKAADGADSIGDFIDKVQEAEEQVVKLFMDSLEDKADKADKAEESSKKENAQK